MHGVVPQNERLDQNHIFGVTIGINHTSPDVALQTDSVPAPDLSFGHYRIH